MSDYHHSVHGSSSSSRSNPMGYEYEVFLSFRGPDTRTKFTDHLYQRLVGASIDVFKDNMELPSGKEIGPQLLKGIENSKMYIVILSAGYARSKWCLEEAVNMVHCMDTADRLILPVFYHVTPHDVRHQTGDHYGPAFMEHENNHPWDTIDKWKVALSKIGKLKGWEIKDGNTGAEGEIVEEILNDVIKILDKFKLDVPHDYLVGIDDHVDEVRDMLAIEIADVRIVGICGMGGIGKTTIAKLVYNQLSYHFERCCFLENVREASSQSSGMKKLQSQLASDLFLRGQPEFDNTEKGKSKLRQRMPHEKVLILLDDADRREQLSNLLPSLHKYAAGSRIIVTTRDRAVLEDFEVQHIHEVTGLREEDALVLFCKYAFKQDSPAAELADLSREIVKATGGLPLAIEVIGSHLSSTREVDIWVEALQLLKNEKTIHQRLRISYDPLSDNAKKIFLDVACFFCGMDYRVPAHMWKSRELLPANVRRELCQRCLIKIGNDKKIWMHDLVKDLGREIVRLENEHAGERTRLWRHSDAFDVLEMELGTNKVEAIHLDIGVEDISHHGFDGNKFNNLTILRFLDLGNNNLVGNYKKRLLELNWLSYHGNYPLNIPSDLHSTKLVVLDLSNSSITERRPGWTPTKVLENVEALNLTSCNQLGSIPDFTPFKLMQKLILEDCLELTKVEGSILSLTALKSLSLKNCSKLRELPGDLSSLSNLEELIVDGTLIQEISISEGMKSLTTLSARRCISLTQIPDSRNFMKLQQLLLNYCGSLKDIPESIGYWKSLEELNISHTSVMLLPESMKNLINLKVLDISHSAVRYLPHPLEKLEKLQAVDASHCRILAGTVSFGVENPPRLRILRLDHSRVTEVPSSFHGLSHLQTLSLRSCSDLLTFPVLPSSLINLSVTCRSPEAALHNWSNLVHLKQLHILGCPSILTISDGIDKLSRLKELFIGDCPKLGSLPLLPSSIHCLQLSGLPSLKELPSLSGLKRLSRFSLSGCSGIVEIPGLKQLVSLKALRISSPLINIEGLECIPSLSSLLVEECEFEKIYDLQEAERVGVPTEFAALETLEISRCKKLERLPAYDSWFPMLKELKLMECYRLEQIPALSRMMSLEVLEISHCREITAFPNLSSLKRIRQLKLNGCSSKFGGILSLGGMTSLEILEILDCEGITIRPADLPSLQNLKQLTLVGVRAFLEKLIDLTSISNLEKLCIDNCSDLELVNLSSLGRIQELRLGKLGSLVEISGLAQLDYLEVLHIVECGKSTEPRINISRLWRLRELRFSGCQDLMGIEGLEELVYLEVLELSHSERVLREINHFEGMLDLSILTMLRELTLDCQEIKGLEKLVVLEVLSLSKCVLETEVLNLSNAQKLRKLELTDCEWLVGIQVGELNCKLYELSINGCERLKWIRGFGGLDSLVKLSVTYCKELEEISFILAQNIDETNEIFIQKILDKLSMGCCLRSKEIGGLRETRLKIDISKLNKMRELSIVGCPWIKRICGLGELKSLVKLDITYCKLLEKISDVSNICELEELIMIGCRCIKEICRIGELTSLVKLDFSWCESLENIPDISYLDKLKELSMVGCLRIKEICGLGELKSLVKLNLSKCEELEEIPDISNISELEELIMIGCRRIKEICGIGELTSLVKLDLSWCESLEKIPDISYLDKLKELSMVDCQRIKEICGLGELTSLVKLNLSGCESLEKIPDISYLYKLKELSMVDCGRIKEICGLGELTSLVKLNLSKSEELEEIPDISNICELEELIMIGCRRIKEICGLGELTSLVKLDLSKCESLEKIPDISHLDKLEELSMVDCGRIQEIWGLGKLKSLVKLDLSSCESIEKIPDIFILGGLEELTLSGCKRIERISKVPTMCKLKYLDISGCEALNEIPHLSEFPNLFTVKLSRYHHRLVRGTLRNLILSVEKVSTTEISRLKKWQSHSGHARSLCSVLLHCLYTREGLQSTRNRPLPAYYPRTNYLSPRPQFLLYRPSQRIGRFVEDEGSLRFDPLNDGSDLEGSEDASSEFEMDNLFCRDHLFTRSVLMASIFVALVARTVIGGTDNAPAESYTKTAEEEEAGPESEPDGAVISEEEEDTEEKSEMEARRFFTGSMLITWIFVSSVTGFAIVGTNYAPAASYIGAKGLNFPVEAQKLRDNMADNMNLWCANSLSNPVAEDRDDEGDELQEDEPEENKFRRTNPETELSAMFEVAAIHDQPENNSSDALAFISARSNAIQPYRIIAPAGVLIVAVFAAVGAYLVHVKKRATSANGPQLEKGTTIAASMESPFHGSFTTQVLIPRKHKKGGEELVITPVRRSYRLRNRSSSTEIFC